MLAPYETRNLALSVWTTHDSKLKYKVTELFSFFAQFKEKYLLLITLIFLRFRPLYFKVYKIITQRNVS